MYDFDFEELEPEGARGDLATVPVQLDGRTELVRVDQQRGPVVRQPDGSMGFLGAEVQGCIPRHPNKSQILADRGGPPVQTWDKMGVTCREVALHIAAKKNAGMREWRQAVGVKQLDAQIPDFLRPHLSVEGGRIRVAPRKWDLAAYLQSMQEEIAAEREGPRETTARTPILLLWYSGGFTHAEGKKLLAPLVKAAQKHGVKDTLVLGFPDEYGITGEGYDWWELYVDRLEQEVADAFGAERPLLLFGHSRGCCAAMSLATRLARRVLKVYVAACPPIALGEPTGWELLSRDFKKGGNKELLLFLAAMQPGNALLTRTAMQPVAQLEKSVKESKWLGAKCKLMRLQYRDACFPRMEGASPAIDLAAAPLMAFAPLQDLANSPDVMDGWRRNTASDFRLVQVNAGHMDCLGSEDMLRTLGEDMALFLD